MDTGHWFLSLYNDDGDPHEVTFIAVIAEDMTHNCPSGCSGKGECLLGHCQCNPGFGGDDCSESVCPVLCSQRGEFVSRRPEEQKGGKPRLKARRAAGSFVLTDYKQRLLNNLYTFLFCLLYDRAFIRTLLCALIAEGISRNLR